MDLVLSYQNVSLDDIVNYRCDSIAKRRKLRGILYVFINIDNKKLYFGNSVNTFCKRYGVNRKNWHSRSTNPHFKNALKQYDGENFKIKILHWGLSRDELFKLEEFYVSKFRTDNELYGYNFRPGGDINPTKQLNTKKFIERAVKIHKDKYDYSKVEYKDTYTRVIIFCKKCNVYFEQTPAKHLSGAGHKACIEIENGLKRRRKFSDFVADASKIHGDKYEYLEENYCRTHEKMKIFCKKCNDFFYQTPKQILRGRGCRQCNSCKRVYKISVLDNRIIKIYNSITEFCDDIGYSFSSGRRVLTNKTKIIEPSGEGVVYSL